MPSVQPHECPLPLLRTNQPAARLCPSDASPQAVLKRKTEEAEAAKKRLRELMEVQARAR
jgi:hypothetical protein